MYKIYLVALKYFKKNFGFPLKLASL